ncbi:MAG: carboxypeptidase-like regulatory domain-containing protein [Bacteroidales bacterium]|nr:carboxypeptidase-like regulatory domain-containing protein [Bacteroidales bacterium]
MRIIAVFIIAIFCFESVIGQNYSISGRVIDADSRKPLPFVNIMINSSDLGGTSDIDGKFSFRSPVPVEFLKLSYVGYEPKKYEPVDGEDEHVIPMKKVEYELPEFIVYPTENPAHRIIQHAIDHIDNNDPEKLPSFSYTAYDKMIFTLDPDSLPLSEEMKSDSADEFRQFIDNHHLFMMESVAERKFKSPDNNVERVIASKMSGFKDPIIVFVISQWQSTSFYNNRIEIMGKPYVNPISRGSTDKYFFLLQDTLLYGEHDSVFVISFRPKKNTNFDGLTGHLSINTKNWAIQNVIAEPYDQKSALIFRIEQMYELVDGEHWFPVQVNNLAILRNVIANDSAVNIGFGDLPDSVAQNAAQIPFGIGKRYIRNIQINPEIKNREFGNAEVDVDPNANFRDEDFWRGYRVDSLTQKELNTYHYIDSLGEAENFDRYARNVESLLTGRIPWGHVDLLIDRFLTYNDFEGFAPGLGIATNDRLSEVFHAGGFFRYGFRDDRIKYGLNADLLLYNPFDLVAGVSYFDDVTETSGVEFWDRKNTFINEDQFRKFLIQRMDLTKGYDGYLNFRTLKYMNVHLGFSVKRKETTTDYRFSTNETDLRVLQNQFDFTNAILGIRYAYKEKFVKNMRKKISLGTNYPIVKLQYTRGFAGLLEGDFDYNRIDLNIKKSFYTNYLGRTSFSLMAGYVDSDIPYTDLFNGNGSWRTFTIYAPGSFATMRMNEFLSSRYIALYVVHDFENLLLKRDGFNPEFAIATHIGFGDLDHPESQYNVNFKTMEKGYYESGLLINNLLNLRIYKIGIGAFYRFGPYSFSNAWDNVGLKFTLKTAF